MGTVGERTGYSVETKGKEKEMNELYVDIVHG